MRKQKASIRYHPPLPNTFHYLQPFHLEVMDFKTYSIGFLFGLFGTSPNFTVELWQELLRF